MDLQRDPAIVQRRKRRQVAAGIVAGIAVIGLSVAVSQLKPAAPTVELSTLWPGTVKRGPMIREVRGAGTLVPEDTRWIPSNTAGRVERIVLRPGAIVTADSVILELSNPDLEQNVRSAEMDWKTAVAQLSNQRVSLANARLAQEAAVADAESAYKVVLTDLQMNESLAESGLVAPLTMRQKEAAVAQAGTRRDLARKQLQSTIDNAASQLAPSEAAVSQRKAAYDRLARQLADLRVKPQMSGQLQALNVEVGQQVGPGTNLARVANPAQLKAEVRISETQAKDVTVGQKADVDTRNGHVPGIVSRVDPAASNGTVGVDITLEGPLPAGARPDLSVDATIELERLANVLFVETPAFGKEFGVISLFKIGADGEATRTAVTIGRRSVQFVEVVKGLAEGDKVILSDMSQYDGVDRVRLN
jgi:HlyD family secretion protein